MAGAAPGQALGALLLRTVLQRAQPAAVAAAAPGVAPPGAGAAARRLSSAAASTSGREPPPPPQQQQQQQQQQAGEKETLEQIRARVFDTALGDGRRLGRASLLRPLRGKEIASWYHMAQGQQIPFLEDDTETDRLAQVARFKATGRAPPKKGQGKRSGKK
ncbi:MAG: hypothetical protein J3K34DRAFT_473258 [Monoraphidium minutum]|nr:MAG: hypothetical protein J3K34DRAFT_473258 [Monoraphidium minutum]